MDATTNSETPQDTLCEEIKSFFDSAPPLKDGPRIRGEGTGRVVCVASGGTTVPLDKRCVHYIDNFSSDGGGRRSMFLILFTVQQSHSKAVKRAISEHCGAVEGGLLLKLPFTSIFDYLQILQLIAMSMRNLETHTMFYLATAASDFYVPWNSMVEHKLQSGSGPLDMQLVQVPKMFSVLRNDWAPMSFFISFKLETDSNILLQKADMALKKYKMHVVVANELSTRKEKVVVVTSSGKISVL
ncbi:hypothetical protein ACSBR2_028832 [Camellia fascicularis]